ncbi:uncharacterized protein ACNS7B_021418 isoform 1-T1 [Menidia menidia]
MMDPQQPILALAHRMAEMAAVSRDQAAVSRQQLEALLALSERRTLLLEAVEKRTAAPPGDPAIAGIQMGRLTERDDPQSFLGTFEATASACGWPEGEWAVRLLPLLSGEAQTAALGLPAASRGRYPEVQRAVLDRLGLSAEDQRRRFREAQLGPDGRPFGFAQQLRDAATRWLQPGEAAGEQRLVEAVVLEQFVAGLPAATSDWVRCHRPAGLAAAVTLAEDHLAVVAPRQTLGGEPSALPTPAPRRRSAPAPSPGAPTTARPLPAPRSRCSAPPQVQVPAAMGAAPHPQGVPQAAGLACWRCGRPGHVRRECPLMEVGQVIRVVGPPAPSPGPRGTYSVPVRIQGGTHQAMVDSGCTQSMVHQSLVRPGALLEAGCVDIMCVHGDVHRYPVVPVEIRHRGKKHNLKAAVSPRLAHPLILGTDWPGFDKLVGQCVGVRSRPTGTWDMCAVLSGDARSSDAADGEGELAVPPPEAPLVPAFNSMEDFPLEQSRDDTLRCAFDQVMRIDGHMVHPDTPLTYPHFSLRRDRLYRVSRDTQTSEVITQLLVPKSRREIVFQAAHYNPMAGHMGYDKTLNRIMARFYWPGIRADVRRWCAVCPECQLVNPAAIPRAPLRPLPLMEVPFERVGMDLIGPFHRSARGYRFVLVLVDYATRYPEAVPLRTISAKSVAQALFQVISRVGIPKEILTDQGTQFMSRTLRELYGLLDIKSIRTSVYHPQTDGLVERLNKTLKSMIRKFGHERICSRPRNVSSGCTTEDPG